jgi:hypothetical protein
MTDQIRNSFVVTRTIKIRPNYTALAKCDPSIERGLLRCAKCGTERKLSVQQVAQAFRRGWPMCCGWTMALVSVEPGVRTPADPEPK